MSKSGKTKSNPTPDAAPVIEPAAATTPVPTPPAAPKADRPTQKKAKTPAPAAVQPVVVAAPAQTPEELAAEYDLGDSAYDPSLDAFPVRAESPPAASTDAAVEPETETEANPAPALPEQMVSLARTMSLDDDEIAGMTEAELGRTLKVLYRRQQQWQPPAPQHNTTPAKSEDDEYRDRLINEKGFDAELADEMVSFRKYKRETDKKLEQYEQREQDRSRAAAADRLDRILEAHNPEFFGKGSYGSLKPNQLEARRRRAVTYAYRDEVELDRQTGRQRTHDQLLAAALEVVAPSKAAAPTPTPTPAPKPAQVPPAANGHAKPQPRISEEVWNQAGSGMPTNRVAAAPKGEKAAILAVSRFMADRPGFGGELDELESDDASRAGLLD